MKFIIALLVITFGIIGFFIHKNNKQPYGTVIILNGPSGSGKSSIQKEFQKIMMLNLWLKVGIDNLLDSPMPEITLENIAYWQKPNEIRWVETTKDENAKPVITLFLGEQGERVAYAMNSAIAAYASNGCNVIVDYIAYKKEWLEDLQQKLKPFNTYYIAVDISLDTLEKREAARGTSPQGHARSHYFTVYGNIHYDLRVNSEKYSAQEIAHEIKKLVQ